MLHDGWLVACGVARDVIEDEGSEGERGGAELAWWRTWKGVVCFKQVTNSVS
jgi:hypothetical protein